jgi:hypothetical protein
VLHAATRLSRAILIMPDGPSVDIAKLIAVATVELNHMHVDAVGLW